MEASLEQVQKSTALWHAELKPQPKQKNEGMDKPWQCYAVIRLLLTDYETMLTAIFGSF